MNKQNLRSAYRVYRLLPLVRYAVLSCKNSIFKRTISRTLSIPRCLRKRRSQWKINNRTEICYTINVIMVTSINIKKTTCFKWLYATATSETSLHKIPTKKYGIMNTEYVGNPTVLSNTKNISEMTSPLFKPNGIQLAFTLKKFAEKQRTNSRPKSSYYRPSDRLQN